MRKKTMAEITSANRPRLADNQVSPEYNFFCYCCAHHRWEHPPGKCALFGRHFVVEFH